MTHHITYPDIDSDVYKLTEERVRRAIRLLLKEGHAFDQTKLLRRQEISYAMRDCSIPADLLSIIVFPYMDIRDWIWDEYAQKRLWTLEEAAALSVGIDPFCYSLEPGQYYPGWRMERDRAYDRTLEAIRLRELESIKEGDTYLIRSEAFCFWANNANLLTSELAQPLRGLAHDLVPKHALFAPEIAQEQWHRYAKQREFAEALSHAEVRKRELYTFAITLKFHNPALTREAIAKQIFASMDEGCQELKGFRFNTIRKDLSELDQILEHPTKEFLRSILSVQEARSTDSTHLWWSLWRPIIASKLPWLKLPD
jgi:hypothetical protein